MWHTHLHHVVNRQFKPPAVKLTLSSASDLNIWVAFCQNAVCTFAETFSECVYSALFWRQENICFWLSAEYYVSEESSATVFMRFRKKKKILISFLMCQSKKRFFSPHQHRHFLQCLTGKTFPTDIIRGDSAHLHNKQQPGTSQLLVGDKNPLRWRICASLSVGRCSWAGLQWDWKGWTVNVKILQWAWVWEHALIE